ncbi:amino acid ABC transporter substrate-binding protein, PAAT family [Pseudomonas guineae]|uniref:Amino acid ABC transporter substrate-binding protein, PAAT family n=1 Tax=Pseudomonas guineae TaxID=425504 RepID=A0A1I3EQJ6_9PSED|nr:transporter substrate-binding domain-containing protein [Pseudomonas guineae]SFI01267.1 amino acid ABC transporter substrate-binding protein, PAAT family [Pseudomonas guineae]
MRTKKPPAIISLNRVQVLLGFTLWLLAAYPAQARPLNIVTIDIPPFGMALADGQPHGIMYEISNRIAAQAGFASHNMLLPYARTVIELKHGRADFVLRFDNDALDQAAIKVAPIFPLRVIVLGAAGAQLHSLSDMHGLMIGVMRDGRFNDAFAADVAIGKYPISNYEQGLSMVVSGRLDGLIGSDLGIYTVAEGMGLTQEQFSQPLVLGEQYFWLFYSRRTADDVTLERLKKAVDELRKKQVFAEVVQRHARLTYLPKGFAPPSSNDSPPR